jgi:hypothetical protein
VRLNLGALTIYFTSRKFQIEKYALYYSSSKNRDETERKLSIQESQFLMKYQHLLRVHLNESVLKHLPDVLQVLDEESEHIDMSKF